MVWSMLFSQSLLRYLIWADVNRLQLRLFMLICEFHIKFIKSNRSWICVPNFLRKAKQLNLTYIVDLLDMLI